MCHVCVCVMFVCVCVSCVVCRVCVGRLRVVDGYACEVDGCVRAHKTGVLINHLYLCVVVSASLHS